MSLFLLVVATAVAVAFFISFVCTHTPILLSGWIWIIVPKLMSGSWPLRLSVVDSNPFQWYNRSEIWKILFDILFIFIISTFVRSPKQSLLAPSSSSLGIGPYSRLLLSLNQMILILIELKTMNTLSVKIFWINLIFGTFLSPLMNISYGRKEWAETGSNDRKRENIQSHVSLRTTPLPPRKKNSRAHNSASKKKIKTNETKWK